MRLPISLADQAGLLSGADLPDTLTASLVNAETGAVVAENLTAPRHDAGMSIPYWPFRVEVSEIGVYSLVVEGGPADGAGVQVVDSATVGVPLVGSPLPPFDTPTLDDPRGVDPLCTRTPEPCPFHDVTLTEALASSLPVVYLIGTPAHCSTGSCAPALDGLLALKDELADRYVVVHAEDEQLTDAGGQQLRSGLHRHAAESHGEEEARALEDGAVEDVVGRRLEREASGQDPLEPHRDALVEEVEPLLVGRPVG
ncbi:MAG: hypothetical protein RIT23_1327, partial [Actinomycetota bacterium]